MPVATRRSKLYEAILEFDDYYTNDIRASGWAFVSHALGGPRTVKFHIETNWNLLRKLWEEKSKPHTFITLKMYLRWKQNRSKD
jgi:hypothetical protein